MPPGPVTVTCTMPDPAGLTAVIFVADTTVTLVAGVVPKSTIVPPVKSVPVMVTVVPPAAEPGRRADARHRGLIRDQSRNEQIADGAADARGQIVAGPGSVAWAQGRCCPR